MRLEPLYRLRFDYPESWSAEVKGDGGSEEQHLLYAEGSVEGRVNGLFKGANFARRRTDRRFLTDFRGVIQVKEGGTIILECRGFGRPHTPEYDKASPEGRQWVAALTHVTELEKYRWLNDVICVGTGQVRPKPADNPANPTDLVLDVAELIWEPVTP